LQEGRRRRVESLAAAVRLLGPEEIAGLEQLVRVLEQVVEKL
jgi:hypothetical protein